MSSFDDEFEAVLKMPIEEMVLSSHALLPLRRAKISTVGQLYDRLFVDKDQRIRNLGLHSYKEICTALRDLGIDLDEDTIAKSYR